MFETSNDGKDGYQVLGDNRLPGNDGAGEAEPKDLAEALKMEYENKE